MLPDPVAHTANRPTEIPGFARQGRDHRPHEITGLETRDTAVALCTSAREAQAI
jgi:hypothetical protein